MQGCYSKLTAAYVVLLLGVLAVFGYTPTNDGTAYVEFARVCLAQGDPYPCNALIVGQPFIWNIGIINLTALSLLIAGSVMPLLVLFCFLKALTALLLAKTCEAIFNQRTAIMAFALYVIYPNNWGEVTMINSETPMIFLMMAALYILTRWKSNLKWLFIGGALLAFANWFRPIAVIFLLSVIVYWAAFERENIIRRLGSLLSGALIIVILIGVDSYRRTNHFVFQAESLWFNMAEATYETSCEPHYSTEMFPIGTARHIDDMRHKTAFECSRIWKKRSLEWLGSHKAQYLAKVPARLFYMFYNDIDNMSFVLADKHDASKNYITLPYRHLLSQLSSLSGAQYAALCCTLMYYLLLVFALIGAVALIRQRRWKESFLPLFIIVVGSLMTVIAVHGETRFKSPFMPFVFMLAAVGVQQLKKIKLWQK